MTRVLHIAPIMFSKPNGPTIVLQNLITRLKHFGVESSVLSITSFEQMQSTWHRSTDLSTCLLKKNDICRSMAATLNHVLGKVDIVHIHGIYNYRYAIVAHHAIKRHIPYVITSHGGLQRGTIEKSPIKKILFLTTILRSMLMHAAAMHFFSASEHKNAIYYSSKAKIFYIPNGADAVETISANSMLKAELSRARDKARLVFCYAGRLDIHQKGLDLLVQALTPISNNLEARRVSFWFVGNYLSRSEQHRIEKMFAPLNNIVIFWGSRSMSEKDLIVSYSDVFFHTSRFEGMPLAVLEAAHLGKPLLLTDGTNMRSFVEKASCGWITDNSPLSIETAVEAAINTKKLVLQETGHRAKEHVIEYYNWDIISEYTYNMYLDILQGGRA